MWVLCWQSVVRMWGLCWFCPQKAPTYCLSCHCTTAPKISQNANLIFNTISAKIRSCVSRDRWHLWRIWKGYRHGLLLFQEEHHVSVQKVSHEHFSKAYFTSAILILGTFEWLLSDSSHRWYLNNLYYNVSSYPNSWELAENLKVFKTSHKACSLFQFGGLMGLCLGFSFLSFIEVIYWVTYRLARNATN